jgi:phytoene dehydrogenase-like protein
VNQTATFDVVVIGGGIGGLMAAAAAAKRGRSVLLVERLPHLGGRFTTVPQDDYAITTGALHLVPHGPGGVLARMLDQLGVGYRGVRRDVIGSFSYAGRHVLWKRPHDVLKLFPLRAWPDALKIAARLTIASPPADDVSFACWLNRQTADPTITRLFERVIEFSLSIRADEIAFADVQAILRCVFRYGLPSAPRGGCRAIVDNLARFLEARGADMRLFTQVTAVRIDPESGRVRGVVLRVRRSGREEQVGAGLVISDAGPRATAALLDAPAVLPEDLPVARGLKLHVVSDKSLITHNGILICLDTRRISGIVQVSNAVPSVVPPGQHMLDTFQVLASDDVAEEKRLAVEDLRCVFGADYDRHCRVVRASAFRGGWPVNRVVQGRDTHSQTPLPGLIMVGDAYKPPGHIMIEGVAGSVRNVLRYI